ncbi:NAD-dependent epimerase/dehydratase family protein [Anaerolineae bacterium CFX7]|nr:NAD-dependent epimerase/dehydratase family protein [Anaerolineae bacterium CFX7]
MRILVTGGAGFIGSNIVDAFLAQGHEVAVLDDLSTGKTENLNPRAKFYQADICDNDALTRVFDEFQPELISHQAAKADVRESLAKPQLYATVNIIGSLNLLENARRVGVRKIIYAGTGGATYGEPEYLPVREDHPVNPLDPYGASKHQVEHYLFLYQYNYGLRYTVLRYPNVYGPRQNPFGEAGVIAIFTYKMLNGETPTINGKGDRERDFCYVGDVAHANVLALTQGDNQIYNIGSGIGVNINTVYEILQEATHFSQPAHYGPDKPGEVYKIYLDAAKAKRELGWTPTVALAEGIHRTVESLRAR